MVYILGQYFRGFTVVLIVYGHVKNNTSWCACIYVIRIALSRDHLPVCITRKTTRAENDMLWRLWVIIGNILAGFLLICRYACGMDTCWDTST